MFRTRTIGMVNWMLLTLAGLPLLAATPTAGRAATDLATREQQQKTIKTETDRLVRRVGTMIRLLQYNRLDRKAEKQLLDRMAGTLSGLSREQMVRLIDALEKAGKVEGAARDEQLKEVQTRHEQIVLGLKGLLARFDALKSIDQAAERLDKMARDELDQYLQNAQMTWDEENGVKPNKNVNANDALRARQLAGEQTFLHRDLNDLIEQLTALHRLLPPEHQERHRKMTTALQSSKLSDKLVSANHYLRAGGGSNDARSRAERRRQWRKASEVQWQSSGDIQELASLLRDSPDKLKALRQARQKIARAIDDQEGVLQSTRTLPDKENPHASAKELAELNLSWARGLSSRQASLEFDTRAIRSLLRSHAKETAGKVADIEKIMREAQTALRDQGKRKPPIAKAIEPQKIALAKLRELLPELDRLIDEAEKAKADPLTSLKDTLAKVEQIIKEQKDVRDKTDEAAKTAQTQRLPHLEPKQQDLAERTEDLKQQPAASKAETKEALEKAAEAMEQAAKPLKDKQAPKAIEKQDEALAKLQEAKKTLAERVAEMENRREDIAELEKADQKLEKLIEKESKVAKEAHDKADKDDAANAKDLAKKQDEVTPQTKEIGKELEKAAPEAAKEVAKSAEHMDAAKDNLDKKQIPPAAKDADKAVEKLKEAQKAVAKALDEKKGMEAAEQAAMQPEVDPSNAAEQLAKALEQTEEAAKDSEQAEKQLGKPDAKADKPDVKIAKADKPDAKADKPNLAKLQKDVAKQAEKVDAPKAKEPAEEAAKALEKGDLKKALAEQKKALAELKEAAEEKGEANEDSPEGAPMPAEAKDAGELAKSQKALMEATKALAKSRQANEAAMAALAQAQAQAPRVVQPQLKKAGEQLAKADEELQQAAPQPANEAQERAAEQLKQALDTLKSAMAQAGEKADAEGEKAEQGEAQKDGEGQEQGQGKGQKPGEKPKQGQGKGKKPAKSQEKNETRGNGKRLADGRLNKSPSRMGDLRGEGSFIHLPQRQRELIKQALNDKLPPEYAALIQQYYVNIAKGKAPAKTKR